MICHSLGSIRQNIIDFFLEEKKWCYTKYSLINQKVLIIRPYQNVYNISLNNLSLYYVHLNVHCYGRLGLLIIYMLLIKNKTVFSYPCFN